MARQISPIQSPLNSNSNSNDVIRVPDDSNGEIGSQAANGGGHSNGIDKKALALMVQPSVDYGEYKLTLYRVVGIQFDYALDDKPIDSDVNSRLAYSII